MLLRRHKAGTGISVALGLLPGALPELEKRTSHAMNRRDFVLNIIAATAAVPMSAWSQMPHDAADVHEPGVAVLLVDTDRNSAPIDRRIYGQFLEHINHSVEDGLFAEQIRGAGFEGDDFKTYWKPSSESRLGRTREPRVSEWQA